MPRKRHDKAPEALAPAVPAAGQAPVNVVVVVESGRRRRPAKPTEGKGHPVAKGLLGLAVAKRLTRRRKRPLRKRVAKAVRKGRRKVRRAVRKPRRALR